MEEGWIVLIEILVFFLGIAGVLAVIADICYFTCEYDPKRFNLERQRNREAIHMTWKEFEKFSAYFPDRYAYVSNPDIRCYENPFLYYIDDRNDYFPIQFDTYWDYRRYQHYVHKLKKNKETIKDKAIQAEQNRYKAKMLEELRLIALKEIEKSQTEVKKAVIKAEKTSKKVNKNLAVAAQNGLMEGVLDNEFETV